jgi:hypothetical protein
MRALEDWAWEQDIPGEYRYVLAALGRAYNKERGCFPGQPYMAAKYGLSERTLRRRLSWLADRHYIARAYRERPNRSRSSDEIRLASPLPLPAESAATLPANLASSIGKATGQVVQSYRPSWPHHKREGEKVRGGGGSSYVAVSFNRGPDPDGSARARGGTSADVVETNISNDNTLTLPKEKPAWVSAVFAKYPQLVGRDLARTASDQRLGGEGEIRQRRAILVEQLKDRFGYRDAHRRANATPDADLPTLPAFLDVAV